MSAKQCGICGEWKDAERDFNWRDNGKGRRFPRRQCNVCRAEQMRARYAADPDFAEKHRALNRASMRRRRKEGPA